MATNSQGPSTDKDNAPVVDPTANVIALVEGNAESSRVLRDADIRFNDAQIKHLNEIASLRAANAEVLRVSDLDRLAKTREVDVLAGAAQAASLATAVSTLATASDRKDETLRNLVKDTADKMAKQTSDLAGTLSTQTAVMVKDINDKIAELQRANYQGVGKSSVSDPAMEKFMQRVDTLITLQATGSGKSQGISATVAAALTVLTVLSMLLGFYAMLKP